MSPQLTNPIACKFESVGKNIASTFTGLCSKHDFEMFAPIDQGPINLDSTEQLFLLAYRSILRECHSSRHSALAQQSAYLAAIEEGLAPKDRPSSIGTSATDALILAYTTEEIKRIYDRSYLNKTYEQVIHRILRIPANKAIAVSSVFSEGIYSNETDTAAYIILNIFPQEEETLVIFSFLQEHELYLGQNIRDIQESQGLYQQYLLSKLVLRKCENMVLSPKVFSEFSEQQSQSIIDYFVRTTFDPAWDCDDPMLFLFGLAPT